MQLKKEASQDQARIANHVIDVYHDRFQQQEVVIVSYLVLLHEKDSFSLSL